MNIYTLKVAEIHVETEDTITLCFKQPALRKIKYTAGQYLTLIFRINGRRYIRPYSFSSAPLVDTYLEVTVKRVPNGMVSNHIHDTIKVGDSVETMAPMGDFVYNRYSSDDNVFLWGAGSGITPLIAIAKQILYASTDIHVNIVYGNRNKETTIFSELLDLLFEKFSARFKVWHFHTIVSVQQVSPFLVQGRITSDRVLEIMKDVEASSSIHYICGPSGLKESVKNVLYELKVPKENVFSEDFELVKNPEDFKEIETRYIKLKYNNQQYNLEIVKGKSILECALDAGIELPYSCQTGNCNTCKGTLINGSLKTVGIDHVITDLLDNEYLTCCSYPLTDNVYLEV